MIYLWLKAALSFLAKMIIPPPAKPPVFGVVSPNEQCPACGHRGGKLKCVTEGAQTFVQHLCDQCNARWNSATVCKTGKILGVNQQQ